MGRIEQDPFGFGMPVEIVPGHELADAEEGTLYLMVRVADAIDDHASPGLRRRRTKTLCDGCDEPCWFDPLSWGKLPAHVERLCIQCMIPRLRIPRRGQTGEAAS